MSICLFTGFGISPLPATGTGGGRPWSILQNQRALTDPLFFADILLQNIVPGSRYWIAQASDLTNVLAEGIASESDYLLVGLPVYTNPMRVEVRVRNGSGAPNYVPFKTFAYMVRGEVTIYIAQVEDTINAL